MRFSGIRSDVRQGFTLIEVMVSVAIIGVLAAVVVANLSNGRTTVALGGEARAVAAVIREVQGYALTGKQNNPSIFPCSYVVSKASPTQYRVTMNAHSAGADKTCTPPDLTPQIIGTHQLSSGVSFTAPTFSLTFSVPFGGVSATRIELVRNGSSHSVCIAASGSVSDNPGTTCP